MHSSLTLLAPTDETEAILSVADGLVPDVSGDLTITVVPHAPDTQGNLILDFENDCTSLTTGGVQTTGGLLVAKKLHTGDNLTVHCPSAGHTTDTWTLAVGEHGVIVMTIAGGVGLTPLTSFSNGFVNIVDATEATDVPAGALVVAGGVRIGDNLIVKDATPAGAGTGSIVTAGGISAALGLVVNVSSQLACYYEAVPVVGHYNATAPWDAETAQTLYAVKIGRLVTLNFSAIAGAAIAGGALPLADYAWSGTLVAAYRPAAEKWTPVIYTETGVEKTLNMVITAAGVVAMRSTWAGAGATYAISDHNITYTVADQTFGALV
jgi:hypothetical protein